MKNKHQNGASDWPRYCLEDVKAAARGRWPEILTALGLDPKYLNPKNTSHAQAVAVKTDSALPTISRAVALFVTIAPLTAVAALICLCCFMAMTLRRHTRR